MKKIIVLLNLFVIGFTYAQTSPTITENYIYEKNCLTEDCSKKTESVQYFDGLGRLKQNVAIKATPSGKDIAIPVEYDTYGRQVKSYLPIPQPATLNGAMYSDPLSNASSQYGSEKIYAEKVLESSPLGRVQQQKSVGNDWASHPVQYSYTGNTSDEVKKYMVTTTWQEGRTNSVLSLSGTYSSNTLYKSTVTDEDGNVAIVFKNKKGQIVLSRKKDGLQNADTYYVYDEYGQLAYTIPPLASTSVLTSAMLDDLCYQYRYDGWKRLVEKKIPGKGWEHIVYDKAGRPVFTQDAELRSQGKWHFTKYDALGRVIYTGFILAAPRASLQNVAKDYIVTDSRDTTGFTRNGMQVYYTNVLFNEIITLLSVNYYDTYPSYSFNPAFPSSVMGKTILTDNSTANAVSTKSLPVLGLVKNIEDDNWTKNYAYYDAKGRAIGTYSINHLEGYTKTESDLDFAGVTKQTKVYHKRLSTDTERIITQTYEYDHQNRLLVHKHQIDSNPEEILTQNTYNELSQIINKKVGNNLQSIDYAYNIRGSVTKINDPVNLNGKLFGYEIKYNNPSNPTQAQAKYNGGISEVDWKTSNDQVLRRYDYQYDALNRVKSGIYSEPSSSVPQNNFFNEALSYDLNGNITTLQRNSKSITGVAEMIDNLNYSYAGNRLASVTDTSSNYKGYPDASGSTITYDDNGNMTTHQDKGILQVSYNFLNIPSYMMFDKMYYTRGVWQNENTYYFYKADGTKHRKEHRYSENSLYRKRTTDYLDGFQYEELQNVTPYTLKFVPTAEGYYNFENNKYIYNQADHLGNVRISYFNNGSGAEVLQENNYYPFGLKHEGYNVLAGNPAFNHKYNNKEQQNETGWLDYGWRQYMPELGKWNGMDQLAESYFSTSPYAYVANNPISNTDPDGRWINEDGTIGQAPATWDMLGPKYKSHLSYSVSDGVTQNGGGSYIPFGQTQAYKDLMEAWKNGGTFGLTNENGYLSYWTSSPGFVYINEDGEKETNIGVMTGYKMKLNTDTSWDAYKNWADWGSTTMGGGFKYIAGRRTTLYNSGNWIDNLGQMRSTAYAGRGRGSLIGLRSDYVRTTAMYGKYAKRAGYVGYAISAGQIGYGVYQDGGKFGVRAKVATANVAGGMAGAAVGAWLGAKFLAPIGGAIGVAFFGVGAAPGAAIGGAIGGVVGGIVGGVYGGDYAEELASDILNKPDYISQ